MGWLSVLLSAIAAYLLYRAGHLVLFVLAILSAIGYFWSWGIMHNYATRAAGRRSSYRGGFYDIREDEAETVPDWLTWVNMAFTAAGLVLLVTAVILVGI